MKAVKFDPDAFKEYLEWREENANIFNQLPSSNVVVIMSNYFFIS